MNTLFDLDNPPRKSTRQIVSELKEAGQDFEFYPTTREMMEVVFQNFNFRRNFKILDIGCGLCAFKSFLDEKSREINIFNQKCRELKKYDKIKDEFSFSYYGIEKSTILINKMPKDVLILGTDFNCCTLLDKKTDIIFCNPPYSEFKNWTKRIIREGFFREAFLIIPERWKDDPEIQQALIDTNTKSTILGSYDFLNAERKARAKINIVELQRNIEEDPFDWWFKDTFKMEEKRIRFEDERKEEEERKNTLVLAKNKIETLLLLYDHDMNKLYSSFKAIGALDAKTLKNIGVDVYNVKEALREKITETKIFYWRLVFDLLDEITCRLTQESRNDLFERFKQLECVDFNEANIRSVVIWVIKNAPELLDRQLINLYKTFTSPDNIIKYKSNQKVFKADRWGWYKKDITHYCLTYRIICDSLYFNSYSYTGADIDKFKAQTIVDDLAAVAYNLGFFVASKDIPESFGEKYYIMQTNGKPLLEFKVYQNGNTHIKLDKEFAKALNVEVARLLGWIRDKSDIAKEFPEEMAEGAEKYYNSNFSQAIMTTKIKLLTSN